MELEKLVEAVNQSKLPFVYSGEKLNDEKCQNCLKLIGADTNVLAVISSISFVPLGGLAILKTGIKFSIGDGFTGETIKVPKMNGQYTFNDFIIHDLSVKLEEKSKKFFVYMVIWNISKKKPINFQFSLSQDDVKPDDAMKEELENILKFLVTKTGTEYVEETVTDTAEAVSPKDPNTFDFEYNNIHTIITLDEKNVVIKKLKIDEKTKIQTPKEGPITISRSSIASVTKGWTFSPLTYLKCIGVGIVFWFGLWLFIHFWVGFAGFVVIALGAIAVSLPMTLTIKRKDGEKFTTRFSGSEKDNADYERFINTIFQ